MADEGNNPGIEEALHQLQADGEAISWPDRRSLAQSLPAWLASDGPSETILACAYLACKRASPDTIDDVIQEFWARQ